MMADNDLRIARVLRLFRQHKLLVLFYLGVDIDFIYYPFHAFHSTMMRGFGLFQFLGPNAACLIFLVYRYRHRIASTWDSEIKKVIYGFAVAAVLIFSKLLADRQIRETLQTNPSQFPSAQQALLAFNVIVLVITILTIFLELALLTYLVGSSLRMGAKRLWEFFVWIATNKQLKPLLPLSSRMMKSIGEFSYVPIYFFAFFFTFQLLDVVDTGDGLIGLSGASIDPVEELIIWSSFVPNQIERGNQLGKPRLFCQNLDRTIWVSPVSSSEIMPSEVVTVEKNYQQDGAKGLHHIFRLVHCRNSNKDSIR